MVTLAIAEFVSTKTSTTHTMAILSKQLEKRTLLVNCWEADVMGVVMDLVGGSADAYQSFLSTDLNLAVMLYYTSLNTCT